MQPTTRRSGGRITRLADRRKGGGPRAVAPGLSGGQYRPLTDAAIRERFPIRLPREAMRADSRRW